MDHGETSSENQNFPWQVSMVSEAKPEFCSRQIIRKQCWVIRRHLELGTSAVALNSAFRQSYFWGASFSMGGPSFQDAGDCVASERALLTYLSTIGGAKT